MNLFTRMCSKYLVKSLAFNAAITEKLTAKHCPPIMGIPMTWNHLVRPRALSSAELSTKKERRKLCHTTCQGRVRSCHKLPFSDNNHWSIPLIWGEGGFKSENFKTTFAIFFCIDPFNSLLSVKSQEPLQRRLFQEYENQE